MSVVVERAVIGSILSSWTGTAGKAPIAFPNKAFTPPVQGAWARMSIQHGSAFVVELGRTPVTHRHPGVLMFQCFAPLNLGDGTALQLAEDLAALFRNSSVDMAVGSSTPGVIRFRTPAIKDVGTSSKDPFYQVNLSIPFIRDYLY